MAFSVPLREEHDPTFFRSVHSKSLPALSTSYLLPVDDDEVHRSLLLHRLVQFLFHGRNYIGPVKEALQFGSHRRILDLGTGPGQWAIDMADEFPRAEVIAIDLAPIQPRSVPPNCTFELCDLDFPPIPYPDAHFDFIHARFMHTGISDYPRFLREIARLLRPGGLLLIIEQSLHPSALLSQLPSDDPVENSPSLLHGWTAFWDTYRSCLTRHGIDVTVPDHLPSLLHDTHAFETIIVRDGNIPVGFWPRDNTHLTVAQLQWMAYDLFLPAVRPLFLITDVSPSNTDRLISSAQRDLYYPEGIQYSATVHTPDNEENTAAIDPRRVVDYYESVRRRLGFAGDTQAGTANTSNAEFQNPSAPGHRMPAARFCVVHANKCL